MKSAADQLSDSLQACVNFWYILDGSGMKQTPEQDERLVNVIKNAIADNTIKSTSKFPIVRFVYSNSTAADVAKWKSLLDEAEEESRIADLVDEPADYFDTTEPNFFNYLSELQVETLEEAFVKNPHPTLDEATAIANNIDLCADEVLGWFNAHRYEKSYPSLISEDVTKDAKRSGDVKLLDNRTTDLRKRKISVSPTFQRPLQKVPKSSPSNQRIQASSIIQSTPFPSDECKLGEPDKNFDKSYTASFKPTPVENEVMCKLILDLTKENQSLKSQLKEGVEKEKAKDEEIGKLRADGLFLEMLEMGKTLKTLIESESVKSAQLESMEKNYAQLENISSNRTQRLEKKIANLEVKNRELELKPKPEDYAKLEMKAKKAERSLEDIKYQMNLKDERIKELEQILHLDSIDNGKDNTLEFQLAKKTETIIKLTREINCTLKPEIKFLKEEVAEYNKTLKEVNVKRFEATQESRDLKIQNKMMLNTIFGLRAKCEDPKGIKAICEKLNKERLEILGVEEKLHGEIDELKESIEYLQEKKVDLQEVISDLHKDNVDKVINGKESIPVEFPCAHCKSLATEYAKAGTQPSDEGSEIKFDATVHEKVSSKFEVRGDPTIKLLRKVTPQENNGGRDHDSAPVAKPLSDADAVKELLASADVVA
ncbi:hypothetical protein GCK72_026004 [Caenorhabditis remanei]|uniref:Homeobox domain-containing protein n=1 Tax=Caenorhabditis remanei TaxID=31234 RepID=A0A6A5G3Q0_CAERE|nr:hypothetical protein GCK72_026004 [Caenorhabditis remanei]KAF1749536.1 hypothetical protein GCK72_026004 [Caenorhabditis remanei]